MSTLSKQKCSNCGKKTIYIVDCKCNNIYCFNCISVFKHNCMFDFKENKKENINKLNPRIIAVKVDNI
jgi:hypothetical protein